MVKRRFYKKVSVRKKPFYDNAVDNTINRLTDPNWIIKLDDRELRSPSGEPLVLPTRKLAHSIADEWEKQDKHIDPNSMPLFGISVTILDRVIPQRLALVDQLVSYGGNDLLCYCSDQKELAQRQQAFWSPWLKWIKKRFGIHLKQVNGVMPVEQPEAKRFALLIKKYNDWELGVLYRVVTLSGSLVLGLAFLEKEIDSPTLFSYAFLDELWQNEQWGTDPDANGRQEKLSYEFNKLEEFLSLIK